MFESAFPKQRTLGNPVEMYSSTVFPYLQMGAKPQRTNIDAIEKRQTDVILHTARRHPTAPLSVGVQT